MFMLYMQVDLPVAMPRLNSIKFTFLPELGDYKTINGETYLNPWFNYSLEPIRVCLAVYPLVYV